MPYLELLQILEHNSLENISFNWLVLWAEKQSFYLLSVFQPIQIPYEMAVDELSV